MRLTIIGFGNQAKAWAQNLKDSGFPIRVALQPQSSSVELSLSFGFETVTIGTQAFYEDRAFALLTPDHTHHDFLKKYGTAFQAGSLMLSAHGFSLSKNLFQIL